MIGDDVGGVQGPVCISKYGKYSMWPISNHYPYRIVTLKEIMSKLTILRDRTIAIMWKDVLTSGDVKDNLGMMSRQMMDEWQYVKSSQSFIYIHMYILKESQTTDQKSELQTFVVSESGHYKLL